MCKNEENRKAAMKSILEVLEDRELDTLEAIGVLEQCKFALQYTIITQHKAKKP